MAEYPYVNTPGALKDFISKLKKSGKPDKIDRTFVASMGFASSNHRRIPGVLRFIGLIDGAGAPTDKYQALRDTKRGPATLGAYIREAYSDLFKAYPDAYRQDSEALHSFFRAHTDLGEQAFSAMSRTFLALCELATFENGVEAAVPEVPMLEATPKPSIEASAKQATAAGGITLNVNIHLDLPADSKVYDELFAAMAKHIFRMGKE